ncbi:MAG: hypothetical protein LC656_02265 [Sphingomonadales bacterium]|nr:hypothetical protein [Sphingomonadales bacterium]
MRDGAKAGLAFVMALSIGAGAALIFWPGVAMYDSVSQFDQVLSAAYDDWHPPIMARLWAMLHGLCGGGTAPMLVLQLVLYAVGFGLIASTLAAIGRWRAAVAVLLLAASPLLLGWQVIVLKDGQMLGATVAGVGIVAAFRLRERAMPTSAILLVAVLLGYATLVRTNAVFAIVPLALLLVRRPESVPWKLALMMVAILLVLAATPLINHRLLGAGSTDIAKSQPLFDLAGITVRTPPEVRAAGFTSEERAAIIARHCAKAFFWDPLGDDRACGAVTARLRSEPTVVLYRLLAKAVLAHPAAYVAHRFAHWSATERWLVPPGLPSAAPTASSEPNARSKLPVHQHRLRSSLSSLADDRFRAGSDPSG